MQVSRPAMPNQRAIALSLGLHQATVSRALRDDRNISQAVRDQVRAEARRQKYRPNAYVSSLMVHIRTGRPTKDMGCIGLLVDAESRQEWLGRVHETYAKQYEGIVRQAAKLGFRIECFCLGAPGMNAANIDRILQARGISGLILGVPFRGADLTGLQWDRYALGTIAYSWATPLVERVASHHYQCVILAFTEMTKRGYGRIGFCLSRHSTQNPLHPFLAGFWSWYHSRPEASRIPLFVGSPEDAPLSKFRAWMRDWKPDAILTQIGNERVWLDQLGLRIPHDIGFACLNRPLGSTYSGIDENHEMIGAATLELVATQILHNQAGLPSNPKLTLIEGSWVEGTTLRAV
jgi:LacI family transcriptional regulator